MQAFEVLRECERGRSLVRQGLLTDALRVYEGVLGAGPWPEHYWFAAYLAHFVALRLGRNDDAQRLLGVAKSLHPVNLWVQMATTHFARRVAAGPLDGAGDLDRSDPVRALGWMAVADARAELQEHLARLGFDTVVFFLQSDHALGHQALQADIIARYAVHANASRALVILVGTERPANRALAKMYERIGEDRPSLPFRALSDDRLYFALAELCPPEYFGDVNRYGTPAELYRQTRSVLAFTAEERAELHAALTRAFGAWREEDWFVTVYARDFPEADDEASYRNSDPNDLRLAIARIVEAGGHVVRIGHWTKTRLRYDEPHAERVWDYATSSERSELLDVCLLGMARFMLGSTSGPLDACAAFDTPACGVNAAPPKVRYCGKYVALQPKLLRIDKLDRYLTWREFDELTADIMTGGSAWSQYWRTSGLRAAGLTPIDNTAEELAEAASEMLVRTAGTDFYAADDEWTQRWYGVLARTEYLSDLKVPVPSAFLRRHEDVFFD